MGLSALRKIQLGQEGVAGSAVPATAKLMGMLLRAQLKDREIVQPDDERGSLASAHRSYSPGYLWNGVLEGDLTFEDIMYLLGMAIGTYPEPTVPGGGTLSRLHTWTPNLATANTPDTFTMEFGDDTEQYEAEYCFATGLEISSLIDQAIRFSSPIVGRQLTVTNFTAALADRTVESALAAKTALYMDDTGGTIGSTQKQVTLIDWTWRLGPHFVPKKRQDGNLYFAGVSEVKFKPELELLCEFNAGVATLRDKYVAETRQLVRLKTLGSLIEGALYKTFQIDGAYKILEFDTLDERDGSDVVRLRLGGEYDATWTKLFEIQVQNTLANYPGGES